MLFLFIYPLVSPGYPCPCKVQYGLWKGFPRTEILFKKCARSWEIFEITQIWRIIKPFLFFESANNNCLDKMQFFSFLILFTECFYNLSNSKDIEISAYIIFRKTFCFHFLIRMVCTVVVEELESGMKETYRTHSFLLYTFRYDTFWSYSYESYDHTNVFGQLLKWQRQRTRKNKQIKNIMTFVPWLS